MRNNETQLEPLIGIINYDMSPGLFYQFLRSARTNPLAPVKPIAMSQKPNPTVIEDIDLFLTYSVRNLFGIHTSNKTKASYPALGNTPLIRIRRALEFYTEHAKKQVLPNIYPFIPESPVENKVEI